MVISTWVASLARSIIHKIRQTAKLYKYVHDVTVTVHPMVPNGTQSHFEHKP